jgi:hypothetical protein
MRTRKEATSDMANQVQPAGLTWLGFALSTVFFWGVYGVLLHAGQLRMADPANGRYKAFLLVGTAYFVTGVLAPLVLLLVRGAEWRFPSSGITWSFVAGVAGAAGAFCTLLAFGAKGSPSAVMAIVFGGAPVVNAIVAIALDPPAGGVASIRWPFFAGILLAASGGFLVTRFRPPPSPAHARAAPSAGHDGDAARAP